MLFEDTALEPETLVLLRRLGKAFCGEAWGFALAGGTALAIQLGHRRSIDLDFFRPDPFDTEELLEQATDLFGDSESRVLATAKNTVNLSIGGVMVDLIRYRYPKLEPSVEAEGYSMFALPDIAAMKLSAVANRGSKKDFFDIARLLVEFELGQILDFYQKKFEIRDTFHVLQSLTFFEDAESEPDPTVVDDEYDWERVKFQIASHVRQLE